MASGYLEVADAPQQHVGRRPRQAGIVQAHQDDTLIGPVGELCLTLSAIQAHGPGHPGNAADAEEVVVGERLQVIHVADAAVHHPDVGALDIADLARGPQHDPAEDCALLRDEEAGKADAEEDGEVLASLAHQHLEGYPRHSAPFRMVAAQAVVASAAQRLTAATPYIRKQLATSELRVCVSSEFVAEAPQESPLRACVRKRAPPRPWRSRCGERVPHR